jgi:predicted DNA-binding protein (MmcQ/YjbR family)
MISWIAVELDFDLGGCGELQLPVSKKSPGSKKQSVKAAPKPKAAKAGKAPAKRQDAILKELRAFGLTYPGAHRKSPWPGHDDLAVNDKTFAYLSAAGEPFSMSCKLPFTAQEALKLPSTSPAAYGLGKSGWVTGRWSEKEMPQLDVLKDWIDESYRAQAPRKLAAQAPYWKTKKG